MLKKTIVSLLILILLTPPTYAGLGPSRLQKEEDENNHSSQKRQPSNIDLAVTVGTGIAVVGALAAMYQISSHASSKDSDSSEEEEASPQATFNKPSTQNKNFDPSFSNSSENTLDHIPIIDLSAYDDVYEGVKLQSARIDLHPVYNNNPRKHLRQEIYELQKAYHFSQTEEGKMIRIITGTGKKRPGPTYVLRENVRQWLQEPYVQQRIANFWLEDEGMFNVILKKNREKI